MRAAEVAVFLQTDRVADRVQSVRDKRSGDVSPALAERAWNLLELVGHDLSGEAGHRYRHRYGIGGTRRFLTNEGDRIFQIRTETFPGHINLVYFVAGESADGEGLALLWDVGSGMESARAEILQGLEIARGVWDESSAALDRLTHVVISHAHIDHFGDAGYFKKNASAARLVVHELDARVIENFEERVTVASKDIGVFLRRAGVDDGRRDELEAMYRMSKAMFESVQVDRRVNHGDRFGRRYEVIHTAGHCPGHICLRVGDHLLAGDHVLSPITPHVSPQSITAFTGLENYLRALMRLRLVDGVHLTLPAHCDVVPNLGQRIDEILEHHKDRLERVTECCRISRTIREVAGELFGDRHGYEELLAVLEAGAHVEYLNELGRLRIANLERVEAERDPVLEFVAK